MRVYQVDMDYFGHRTNSFKYFSDSNFLFQLWLLYTKFWTDLLVELITIGRYLAKIKAKMVLISSNVQNQVAKFLDHAVFIHHRFQHDVKYERSVFSCSCYVMTPRPPHLCVNLKKKYLPLNDFMAVSVNERPQQSASLIHSSPSHKDDSKNCISILTIFIVIELKHISGK